MYMHFLCCFARTTWFMVYTPWFIRTEVMDENHQSIPHMIQALRSSAHPRNNILSLFTFLWCLWKAMNDSLFKKSTDPCQVFPAANAIMQGSKLEDNVSKQDHQAIDLAKQSLESQQDPFSIAGNVICTDAAWKCGSNQDLAPTVI